MILCALIHLDVELGQSGKSREGNPIILVSIDVFKLNHDRELVFNDPYSPD
jgi:hypothetical protein